MKRPPVEALLRDLSALSLVRRNTGDWKIILDLARYILFLEESLNRLSGELYEQTSGDQPTRESVEKKGELK